MFPQVRSILEGYMLLMQRRILIHTPNVIIITVATTIGIAVREKDVVNILVDKCGVAAVAIIRPTIPANPFSKSTSKKTSRNINQ